jgi:hypothetical protein
MQVTCITHRPRSDLPRLPRGHLARLVQREQRDVVGAARGDRVEHPHGGRNPRRARRVRATDHQWREHRRANQEGYQGQPKQIAAALWGSSAAQYRYKHVTVVEEDIDPASYEQVDWAFAHRVNAGEEGIVIFPGIFGSPIDPSTPMEDRDVARLGTGLWNRVLIDATRSWKLERRPEWGGERFPPTVRPAAEDEARVRDRWEELGLGDL